MKTNWLRSYRLMLKWTFLSNRSWLSLNLAVQIMIAIGFIFGISYFYPAITPDVAKRLTGKGFEVLVARGTTVDLACKQLGVTDQTYYRWRKEYGGLRTDQAKRLKELEQENGRLKRLLADAELDKAILKEAASGNF